MIVWIIHPTQLGNLLFFCLEYLTLLMSFGTGDYNHTYVCGKELFAAKHCAYCG